MKKEEVILKLIEIFESDTTRNNIVYGKENIKTKFELSAKDFIEFAEKDLNNDYNHRQINALSNAKRALDVQLDTMLIGFGLYKVCKKSNWGFPRKIEILKDLGIIAPRVLSKINKARNLMEHEFIKPTIEQVENFIDIVSLFLAATSSYISSYKCSKEINRGEMRKRGLIIIKVSINYQESIIEFDTTWLKGSLKEPEKKRYELKYDHPNYIRALKAFLKVTQSGK